VSLPSLSSLVRGRDWIQGRNWKMWTGIAVTALAAVQLYFVRELLAALFIFTIVFAVVASVFLMLWLIDRAGQRTLAWAEPQTRELARLARVHFAFVLAWAVIWIAMILGVPLQQGGAVTVIACWTAYVAANFALAWVLVRFTAIYGSLPESSSSDALFVRLIGTLAAQPIMTALAFSVLTHIMGVGWNPLVPALPAVQEGI